ncbi:MAG TPA: SPOR domain-containing protein [Polyangiaceae bacterium]|jgi:cell division septation protein DedD
MESVNVRNLEQIQEEDRASRSGRLGALLLASLGGAALVTVALVMAKRSGPPAHAERDPLAELVKSAKVTATPAEQLEGRDVTFPGILSDAAKPTTALAAVKDERGRLVDQASDAPAAPTAPPPPTDRLPVVPLPVGTLLAATPVITEPKDSLTELAHSASSLADNAEMAPSGMEGGYQLQVASYREQADADRLVEDLRKRGHRAFRQAAYVPERGLWQRVRIGPFKNKYEAVEYKAKFERSERLSPFLVDPEKVKQAEEQRALRVEKAKKFHHVIETPQ